MGFAFFSRQKEENKMSTEKINKLIIKMGIPMIISMILQALYNVVDSVFVSNMGKSSLLTNQALTYAFPISEFITSIISLLILKISYNKKILNLN